MIYVKSRLRDTWHFCRDCSMLKRINPANRVYQGSGYERSARPPSGELCNECRAREKSGKCGGNIA